MPHNDEKPFTMAEFDAEMAAIRKAHRERPLPPPPGARPKLRDIFGRGNDTANNQPTA